MKKLLLLVAFVTASAEAQTVTPPVVTRNGAVTSSTASVTWPTVYDSSRVRVTSCAQIRVGGVTKNAVCRTKTAPWVRHIDSAVTVSRVAVKPITTSLASGTSQRFCAIIGFADGASAIRAQDKAECEQYHTPLKAPTPRQQARADSLCVQWRVVEDGSVKTPCPAGTLR